MIPHLVADEIRRRGVNCVHTWSWDDFDRLRKISAGVDPTWAEHIGKPLTSVPAPAGSTHPNWVEHFKAPMEGVLRRPAWTRSCRWKGCPGWCMPCRSYRPDWRRTRRLRPS